MKFASNLMLCVALALAGCQRAKPPVVAPAVATTGTVTIEINHDGETRIYTVPDVAGGTSLETIMRSIDDLPITITGSGTTAFVHAIGDHATNANEGWTYKIDGEFVHSGIGSAELTPPTTVSWTFGESDIPQ